MLLPTLRDASLRDAPQGEVFLMPIHAATLEEDGKLDPVKAFVMAELDRLVAAGSAAMVTLESGTRELRLATGEVFRLGNEAVTRIA